MCDEPGRSVSMGSCRGPDGIYCYGRRGVRQLRRTCDVMVTALLLAGLIAGLEAHLLARLTARCIERLLAARLLAARLIARRIERLLTHFIARLPARLIAHLPARLIAHLLAHLLARLPARLPSFPMVHELYLKLSTCQISRLPGSDPPCSTILPSLPRSSEFNPLPRARSCLLKRRTLRRSARK